MGQKITTPEENRRLQRVAAEGFKRKWPATDSIRFTDGGTVSGSGSWAADAVVSIGGKEYEEAIGPSERIGDPLPEPDALPPTREVVVYYSNGTSEVLG